MKQRQTEGATEEAINFLVSRIDEQAQAESIPLSRAELKQLSFSEETASDSEIAAAAAEFDANNDTARLESKVAKLLRHAFEQDVKSGNRALLDTHLDALANKDVYVLVMVDEARISRPKPNLVMAILPKSKRQTAALLRLAMVWALPLAGAFYFIVLPMKWSPTEADAPYIFGSLVDRLQVSDGVKGGLFLGWLAVSIFLLYFPNQPEK